jgi:DHA1 family bicyclomycin/chloramphenicol resistance-like MFS transporter
MAVSSRVSSAPVPLIIPVLLVAATSASVLSTDLYTPSLPHLTGYFQTSAETVQLTMSLNLFGFGVAQLFYGPLSDYLGRRPVLLGGMVCFAVISLICAFAYSIEFLILARTLQGVTACAEAVVGLAIIRDLYDEEDSVRVLAAYGMAVAVAPAVGPLIGGYVHVLLGWQANFVIVSGFVVVVAVLIWRFLPETLAQDSRIGGRPMSIARDYVRLMLRRGFIGYALPIAFTFGALYAFITAAPFVLIERMGVATQHYGLYYAALVLAYFFASLVANRIVGRLGIESLLRVSLLIGVVGGIATLGVVLAHETPGALTAAISIGTFGLGFLFATAPVRALAASDTQRGLSAALLGSLEMGIAALAALTVGIFHNGTAWPLALTFAGCNLIAAAIYIWCKPWRAASAGAD